MKTNKLLSIVFVLLTMTILSGCEKEESIITGRLTYIGALSGIEYLVPNETIYLYLGSTSGQPYASVNTDAQGYFQFQRLWAAHWYIYSTVTVNGLTYQGVNGTTAVDGKNVVTLNLVMQ